MKSYAQRRSKLQEKRAARDVGGREQPASGALPNAKGDFRKTGSIRGECKHTTKSSFTLKLNELLKIQEEALKGGFESPVMQVEFVGQLGQNTKLAVITEGWFRALAQNADYFRKVNFFQVGKQFILRRDEWILAKGCNGAVGYLPAWVVVFDTDSAPGNYVILDWADFIGLKEAADAR